MCSHNGKDGIFSADREFCAFRKVRIASALKKVDNAVVSNSGGIVFPAALRVMRIGNSVLSER